VLRQHRIDQPRHIGIVGLGVGTLAAYGQVGDRIRMYEINPAVIAAAEQQFSFLRDCAAEQVIITGDARLSLEFEEPQEFDVLVLDAFSGDAIPVHLLTREAIDVYLKHLREDGVLACHISNLHFNLKPVIAGLAAQCGLEHVIVESQANDAYAAKAATWAILARTADSLPAFDKLSPRDSNPTTGKPIIWTDNRSNLLEVMWH
jgi:spermidine synthase